jgi:FG-GAP-like repeat
VQLRIPNSAVLAIAALALGLGQSRPADVAFAPRTIDIGASETAAVADVNRDGRPDIISGERWYEAPAWTPHRFRTLGFSTQYVDSFSDLPLDVDGDGFVDVVGVSWFARHIVWWRNPGTTADGPWVEAGIDSGFPVEFARLADLDNDGRALEVLPQPGTMQTPQAWYEAVNGTWVKHVVSPKSYGHGIGAGDVNGDGRTDILTPRGWLEAPADPRGGDWTLHAAWAAVNPVKPGAAPGPGAAASGPAEPPAEVLALGFMHVLDVNGDGRNDVVAGAAHDYGVYWFEQLASGGWTRHAIDTAWSQAHASTLADVNGDGRLDVVTGKRFMAHNGSDPGGREPLGVYWYEWLAKTGGGEWVRHVIDYGGRMGGGMQIPAVDLDGDGDLDLVCPGKSGLFVVMNERLRPQRGAGGNPAGR